MRYSRIALALQEISQVPHSRKVDLAAGLLAEIASEPEMLCPAVRLLLGELWPPWEGREMGIGPEALMAALAEVSDQDLPSLQERCSDMGMVAEAALGQKGQHSLFREPLEALSVYERLRRISALNGKESEQRKNALLRGLFLEATPLEGKYIARTALRNMQAGIGHKTMIAALSSLLHCDQEKIRSAYSLMPDLGSIAAMAQSQKLERVAFRPKVPTRFMLFRSSDPKVPGCFLPKYPGLRVQVHKIKKEVIIFTSQLRNITVALNGISRQLGEIDADFVVDADLIGFHDSGFKWKEICSQTEMLRYINRRRLSRKDNIYPALLAYDLIALQGEDICSMPYQDRRKRLLSILGEPKGMPFSGISPAQEMVLMESSAASDFLCRAEKAGAKALLERDLQAAYRPGIVAERDFIIRAEHNLAALIVRVLWGRGKKEKHLARYQVALRSGEELVPVGWAWRGLPKRDQLALSHSLRFLVKDEDESGADVNAQVVLNLKIRGAHKCGQKYSILEPVIEGFRLNASREDADELERLEKICP
ncbi:MAG: ATP-dependent DNA ligase [Methanothrix sp.]